MEENKITMKDYPLRAIYLISVFALISGACSALTPDDPVATLRAEREGYVAEATTIASDALAQQTQVIQTASAAETYVSQVEARNALLAATLRAVLPPTQQIIVDSGAVTPGLLATPAPPNMPGMEGEGTTTSGESNASVGGTTFTEVATALSVRDSDGCAVSTQNTFAADVNRIYVTARALNITAGTTMRVEWRYNGAQSYTENFTVDRNDDDFCLWFYIEPTEVAFSPGSWSVQLYANDQAIQPEVSFTIGS